MNYLSKYLLLPVLLIASSGFAMEHFDGSNSEYIAGKLNPFFKYNPQADNRQSFFKTEVGNFYIPKHGLALVVENRMPSDNYVNVHIFKHGKRIAHSTLKIDKTHSYTECQEMISKPPLISPFEHANFKEGMFVTAYSLIAFHCRFKSQSEAGDPFYEIFKSSLIFENSFDYKISINEDVVYTEALSGLENNPYLAKAYRRPLNNKPVFFIDREESKNTPKASL